MRNFATALYRHTHGMAFLLLVFLASGFILPNLASAQNIYNIETTTGNNGSDKSIFIVLVGTKGAAAEEFELNAPGDDFRRGAVNKFTYRSDKDLGDITDIALKAHPQDYWEVKKVTVQKTGNKYLSKFTAFRGGLIKGEWTDLFRADNLDDKSVVNNCCEVDRKPLPTKIFLINNLDGQEGDTKTDAVTTESTVTNNIELVDVDKNSMNNTLNINISASYASPVGVSVSTDVAYGLEVYKETSRALTQAASNSLVTTSTPPNLVASPGTIQYVELKTTEIRLKGKVTLLNGETEFYRVVGNEYDYNFYTFNRDTYNEIPEFLIKAKGKPFCNSCNKGKTTVVNNNSNPDPKPVSVVENKATSEVEVCDNEGNVVGYFKKNGNGWVETDTYGNTRFQFSETKKDQGVIYLSDKGRPGVKINLDVNNKEVLYSDSNNTSPFRIYVISKVK